MWHIIFWASFSIYIKVYFVSKYVHIDLNAEMKENVPLSGLAP
jgi:hypothetical protein